MPKLVDPLRKQAEFVAASWSVIAAEGLGAATLRRVAAQAGCTTGSLTHYFPDRRSLLIAALRAAHVQAADRMADGAKRATSAQNRLRVVLLESLPLDAERLREWRVWLAFWAESVHDPQLAEENDRRYAEWRALLRELLAPLVADAAEAEREVEQLIVLVDGLGVRIARNPDDARVRTLQRRAERMVDGYISRYVERV